MNTHPVPPYVHPDELVGFFGPDTAVRGKDYSLKNRVVEADWGPEDDTVFGQVTGSNSTTYGVLVYLRDTRNQGKLTHFRPTGSMCSCPVAVNCKHGAALLYTLAHVALQMVTKDMVTTNMLSAGPVRTPIPEWKDALDRVRHPSDTPPHSPLGIGFDLLVDEPTSWYAARDPQPATLKDYESGRPLMLVMRPLTTGKKGTWIKGGLQWRTIGQPHAQQRFDQQQAEILAQLHSQYVTGGRNFDSGGTYLRLPRFTSSLLWHLLARAQKLGVEFTGQGIVGEVKLGERSTVSLSVEKADEGLQVSPIVELDGRVAGAYTGHPPLPVGNTGFALTELSPNGRARQVNVALAPTEEPVDSLVHSLLDRRQPVIVPPDDAEEFYQSYFPSLRSVISVRSGDGSIELPTFRKPQLHLVARFGKMNSLTLTWDWEYHDPDRTLDLHDLQGLAGQGERRDRAFETTTLAQVRNIWPSAAHRPRVDLVGIETAEFTEHILPRLEALASVRVEVQGSRPTYEEVHDDPFVKITTAESTRTDWFDLGFVIHVAGREVPFANLFAALAQGADKLLLVDGAYFSLDHPVFEQLRTLLAEADALAEWDPEQPRISRYQASLFAEFEELADETDAATSWRAAVQGLLSWDAIPEAPVPTSVHAQLRPYQIKGFQWLAFLYAHGLGGILADDMGLGKTLQTLTFIAHARGLGAWSAGSTHLALPPGSAQPALPPGGAEAASEALSESGPGSGSSAATELVRIDAPTALGGVEHGPGAVRSSSAQPPFLVVAPTSVVSTWKAEAQRFVPGLDVRVLTATTKKRKTPIAQEVAGADVVVTSYAILRIDAKEFAELSWDGLVLDEAQFVKNRAARVHQAAKNVQARFRLAITGTPMENSLTDLWSLLAITAPGLFASPSRFNAEYIKPIESGNAPERMVRLRKRVKPFMLRRTKEVVAADLPDKQEHVTAVELQPKHRKIYDAVLQRERKKVLGLIKDLDRNRFIVFRSLTLLRMLALDPAIVDPVQYEGVPSSKLDVLFEQLDEVMADGHRIIVFSQFTSFLHRVAERLDEREVDYAYLDGSTRNRDKVIGRFKTGDAPVFLISLKAGGFGLTLTEADYVFLLDPWWNPASEAQAIDRTHRIGQSKNVMVYRMVAEGTIEEKVLALQQKKAALFTSLMDNGSAFSDTITADDVRDLLGG